MKASLLHTGIVSYGKAFAITNVARNQLRQQGGEKVLPTALGFSLLRVEWMPSCGWGWCEPILVGGWIYIGCHHDLYSFVVGAI